MLRHDNRIILAAAMVLGVWGTPAVRCAPGAQFPSTGPMPVSQAPATGAPSTAPLGGPQTQMVPIGPSSPPPATLGTPTFDPYSTGAAPGTFQPAMPSQPAIPPSLGAMAPPNPFPGWLPGGSVAYPAAPPPSPLSTAPLNPYAPPETAYPPDAYPATAPPVLFPGGLFGGPAGGYAPSWPGSEVMPTVHRFFAGPRLRHAWLGGGSHPRDLGIHDTDVSLAFAFPNFLYSHQPLYVIPSFSLHQWEGPSHPTADLPSKAYSAFLDTGWQSDVNQMVGAELGLRVGVFTDFDTMNSDSLRIRGQGLGRFRVTPASTLKAGVMYVDRNRVKIIPAGGWLWQPSPYERYDFFFPEPKASRYFRTLGTQDVWGFVAGEFGGGSWAIQRADGTHDSIDINDLRVTGGFEWGRSDLIRAARRTGFVEAGWVFNRRLYYRYNPQDDLKLNPTFIVRAGIGY